MCFMKDGSAMPNGFASSLMLAGPLFSCPSTARRVGSASAWKTPSSRSEYCSIWLSITTEYLVKELTNPECKKPRSYGASLTFRRMVGAVGLEPATR